MTTIFEAPRPLLTLAHVFPPMRCYEMRRDDTNKLLLYYGHRWSGPQDPGLSLCYWSDRDGNGAIDTIRKVERQTYTTYKFVDLNTQETYSAPVQVYSGGHMENSRGERLDDGFFIRSIRTNVYTIRADTKEFGAFRAEPTHPEDNGHLFALWHLHSEYTVVIKTWWEIRSGSSTALGYWDALFRPESNGQISWSESYWAEHSGWVIGDGNVGNDGIPTGGGIKPGRHNMWLVGKGAMSHNSVIPDFAKFSHAEDIPWPNYPHNPAGLILI